MKRKLLFVRYRTEELFQSERMENTQEGVGPKPQTQTQILTPNPQF